MAGLQSVQSLGWGAVAMHELPQLINWSGSDSFKPAKIDPWTALIATSGPAPATQMGLPHHPLPHQLPNRLRQPAMKLSLLRKLWLQPKRSRLLLRKLL